GGSSRAASDGHDHVSAVGGPAISIGDDAFELGKLHVYDTPVPGVHGLERDDLTQLHRLFAKAARHGGQVVVSAAAVAFCIDQDVAALLTWTVDDSVRQELERLEDLPLLTDDAARVLPEDLHDDLVRVLLGGPTQAHLAIHVHVLDDVLDELEGPAAALVWRGVLLAAPPTRTSLFGCRLPGVPWWVRVLGSSVLGRVLLVLL